VTGPKTLSAAIREGNARELGKTRSKRFRERKRGGYVAAGPVNVRDELVRVMIEMGDIEVDGIVSREVMNGAWPRFLERLADRADHLPGFLSADHEERRISSPLFRQEIGLPSAPRQAFYVVEKHLDRAGYRLAVLKKKRPD